MDQHRLLPNGRLRAVLEHFGLTPQRVLKQSAGRFGRAAVRAWIERGRMPRANTAVAFAAWLSDLNRNRERAGLPSLAQKFLTAEWLFGSEGDSHAVKDNSSAQATQRRSA